MSIDLRPYKFKSYTNQVIRDDMLVTLKLDGVMGIQTPQGWVSRNNKRLYNLPPLPGVDAAEIYCGNFKNSISAVHTHSRALIESECIYPLFPDVDTRLILNKSLIIPNGAEGLVIRDDLNRIYYKLKIKDTIDLTVLGTVPGTGKYTGLLGALITEFGHVGTGLTDADRHLTDWIGQTIEIEYMERTSAGKLRHPRFIRRRLDK